MNITNSEGVITCTCDPSIVSIILTVLWIVLTDKIPKSKVPKIFKLFISDNNKAIQQKIFKLIWIAVVIPLWEIALAWQ